MGEAARGGLEPGTAANLNAANGSAAQCRACWDSDQRTRTAGCRACGLSPSHRLRSSFSPSQYALLFGSTRKPGPVLSLRAERPQSRARARRARRWLTAARRRRRGGGSCTRPSSRGRPPWARPREPHAPRTYARAHTHARTQRSSRCRAAVGRRRRRAAARAPRRVWRPDSAGGGAGRRRPQRRDLLAISAARWCQRGLGNGARRARADSEGPDPYPRGQIWCETGSTQAGIQVMAEWSLLPAASGPGPGVTVTVGTVTRPGPLAGLGGVRAPADPPLSLAPGIGPDHPSHHCRVTR